MQYNQEHIEQFLNYKFSQLSPNEFIGLRALPSKYSSQKLSGLYNDKSVLISDMQKLAGQLNVYISVNPLKYDDHSTVNSCAPGPSFKDPHATRLATLYIDIDPVRESNCAATENEVLNARDVGNKIATCLSQKGIQYYSNFSGNGYSFLVNLPNYQTSKSAQIAKLLNYLNAAFKTEYAKVDTTVHSPSQIMRMMGTLNMKGEPTIERPHRLAAIFSDYSSNLPAYDVLELFSTEISSVDLYSKSQNLNKPNPNVTPSNDYSNFKNNIKTLDIVTLVKNYNLYCKQIDHNKHAILCPNRSEHTDNSDGSGATIVLQDGFPPSVAFKCHHDHCQHINTAYFLNNYFDPTEVDKLCTLPFEKNITAKQTTPKLFKDEFILKKVWDLVSEPQPEYEYIVEDLLLSEGLGLLASQPKVGKTTMLRELCVAVAHGEEFFGKKTRKGPVVFLALEELVSQMNKEFIKLGVRPETELYIHAAPAPSGAVEKLATLIETYKPVLLVVDTMHKLVRFKDGNDYTSVNLALEPILALARQYKCSIVLTHHLKKDSNSNSGNNILGSTAIHGAFDTLIYIEKIKDDRIMSVDYRYAPVNRFEKSILKLDESSRLSLLNAAEHKGKILDSEVLNYVTDNPSCTQDQIIEALEKNRADVIKALKRLVSIGLIEKSSKAAKGSPYTYKLKDSVPFMEL